MKPSSGKARLAGLWQELEVVAVAGPVDVEVAPVKGSDAGDQQAFRHSHDAQVDDVEFRARILLRDVGDPR